ncbi:MAG: HEAT repeat domain-containing protein [Terriglobales bacterium]
MGNTERLAASRAFVRSCNVLLKQAALYGLKHKRCAAQLDTTWNHLRQALADGSKLALAVHGDKLMLEGVPLACGTAEKSVATLLAAAGIGRLDFCPGVCKDEFTVIINTFSSSKPADVLAKINPELGKTIGNIRVHEFRVMDSMEDPTEGAGTPGGGGDGLNTGLDLGVLLSDPQKLLQLIGAVETAPAGAASGNKQNTGGSGLQEGDVLGVIRWLTNFAGGEAGAGGGPGQASPGGGVSQGNAAGGTGQGMPGAGLSQGNPAGEPLPGTGSGALSYEDRPSDLQRALQKILPSKPARELRGALLLQLAEHVALRAVNDTYQREGLNVTAIQQMLDRMNQEIESLRKVLHAREEQLGRAGVAIKSNADELELQFWRGVPESAKHRVLLSTDAWVVPPHILRSFVQPLLAARAEMELATAVLRNYSSFLDSEDEDARNKSATGIGQLADLYARVGQLGTVVHCVGDLVGRSASGKTAPVLKESFILLGKQAAAGRDYPALDEWLYLLDDIQRRDPALAAAIGPEVPVQERVPEMVHTAIVAPQPPEALIEVLKRVPGPTARYVIEQFAACKKREEGVRLARVLGVLGAVSIDPIREMLLRGEPADAISSLGLLAVLDPDFLRQELPSRLGQWNRAQQDAALRQISGAGTDDRGALLLELMECLDAFVLPLAIDEIGIAGNVPPERLIHLAQGRGIARELPYLQVKAIEALGRMGEKSAAPLLAQLLTARSLLSWQQPREIRVVAAQSLQRIEPGAARPLISASGLSERELVVGPATDMNPQWIRQRKYPRVCANNKLVGSLESPNGASSLKINSISLGGGRGATVRDPQGITDAELDLFIGMRKLPTRVFIRQTRPHEVSFEFVDISLEDRSRLRGFVAEKCSAEEPAEKVLP